MPIFDDIYDPGFDSLEYIFGETVTYIQHGRSPREVKAIIDRDTIELGPEGIPTRVVVVTVKDSAAGIPIQEISKSDDCILVEKRVGDEPSRCSIMEATKTSNGVVTLLCR